MTNVRMKDDRTRYWTLVGFLKPDNRLYHLPPILIDHPSRLTGKVGGSPLRIDLLDKDERLLVSQPVAFGQYRTDDGRTLEERPISVQVPFHPNTQIIRLWNGHVLVKEWCRPDATPIIDKPTVKHTNKGVRLTWRATHEAKEPMHYVVRISQDGGKTFIDISEQIEDSEFEVSEKAIPGGKGCLFQVAATDGFYTVTAESEPVDLPETGPLVQISSPQDGQTINSGDIVTFRAQLVGFIGQDVTIVSARWMSDRDGKLAKAPVFQTRKLTPGRHYIELTVRDRKGRESSATISLYVMNRTMKKL